MKIGQIKNRIGNYSRSKIVGVSIKFLSFYGSWGGFSLETEFLVKKGII